MAIVIRWIGDQDRKTDLIDHQIPTRQDFRGKRSLRPIWSSITTLMLHVLVKWVMMHLLMWILWGRAQAYPRNSDRTSCLSTLPLTLTVRIPSQKIYNVRMMLERIVVRIPSMIRWAPVIDGLGGGKEEGGGHDSLWQGRKGILILVHYSINHWNYFQTSTDRRIMWPRYNRKLIEFLHIVVWHMRVSTRLLEVMWLKCGLGVTTLLVFETNVLRDVGLSAYLP